MNLPIKTIVALTLGFFGGFTFHWLLHGHVETLFTGLFGSTFSFYLLNLGIPLSAIGGFLLLRKKGRLICWTAAGFMIGVMTFQLIIFNLMWLVAGSSA